MERKTWQVYCFGKKKCLPVRFGGVQREFLSEKKVKVTPCRGAENRNEKKKGAGTKSGESGTRNLEAESIRSSKLLSNLVFYAQYQKQSGELKTVTDKLPLQRHWHLVTRYQVLVILAQRRVVSEEALERAEIT